MWNLLDFQNNTAIINERGETFSYAELYQLTEKLAEKSLPVALFSVCVRTQ